MAAPTHLFDRVVCGADGSETGATAVALAARLTAADGTLFLVTVDDVASAVHAGWAMPHVLEQLARDALDASRRATHTAEAAHVTRVEPRLLEGSPLDCLRRELDHVDATLAVVGTRGHSRPVGIALGSVTTHLLHEAPCSVLVAREPRDPGSWPRSIVVGVDGSEGSANALAAAREIGDRLGADVRAVVAAAEREVDVEAARRLAPTLEEVDDRVLPFLHDVSEEADLLVLGSRGLRGIRALGSVSERVAHEALCPVLVVRGGSG
jgi:nucleotide-binding universal stress UspA family protein